jgi:hypothetical protein
VEIILFFESAICCMYKKRGRLRQAWNFVKRHGDKFVLGGAAAAIAALALSPKRPSAEIKGRLKSDSDLRLRGEGKKPQPRPQPKTVEAKRFRPKKMPTSWSLLDAPFKAYYDRSPLAQKYPDRAWTLWKDFIVSSKRPKNLKKVSKARAWQRVFKAFARDLMEKRIKQSELKRLFEDLWRLSSK